MTQYTWSWAVPGQPAPWVLQRWKTPYHLASPSVQRMRDWQHMIQLSFLEAYGTGASPVELMLDTGLVAIDLRFVKRPAGKRKTYRSQHIIAELAKRPDVTNYQKAAEDALKGLVIPDDAQVVDIRSRKSLALGDVEPHTKISVIMGGIELADSYSVRAGALCQGG